MGAIDRYAGTCIGGPHDGKHFAYCFPTYELCGYDKETGMDPAALGQYTYSRMGGGMWLWEPMMMARAQEAKVNG